MRLYLGVAYSTQVPGWNRIRATLMVLGKIATNDKECSVLPPAIGDDQEPNERSFLRFENMGEWTSVHGGLIVPGGQVILRYCPGESQKVDTLIYTFNDLKKESIVEVITYGFHAESCKVEDLTAFLVLN